MRRRDFFGIVATPMVRKIKPPSIKCDTYGTSYSQSISISKAAVMKDDLAALEPEIRFVSNCNLKPNEVIL